MPACQKTLTPQPGPSSGPPPDEAQGTPTCVTIPRPHFLNPTTEARCSGSCLEPQHFGRLRWADHLRSGVQDQPVQHEETSSLLKIQKLAEYGGLDPFLSSFCLPSELVSRAQVLMTYLLLCPHRMVWTPRLTWIVPAGPMLTSWVVMGMLTNFPQCLHPPDEGTTLTASPPNCLVGTQGCKEKRKESRGLGKRAAVVYRSREDIHTIV
ncbi:hypothetical protein AAY473_025393 [Plecturocebus cupreus]